MLANMWAVGGHTCWPTYGHTLLIKLKWYMLPKGKIYINKTDMEFHSFDHTTGFLSFWHTDLMCLTFMLN